MRYLCVRAAHLPQISSRGERNLISQLANDMRAYTWRRIYFSTSDSVLACRTPSLNSEC